MVNIEVRDSDGHILNIENQKIECGTIILIVDNCELCMESEWNKGHDEGKEEGYDQAREDYNEENC